MSLDTQCVSHHIICHKAEMFLQPMLPYVVQYLPAQHLFLDFHKHAVGKPLFQFFQAVLRMVSIDAQVQKLGQIQVQQCRAMAFNGKNPVLFTKLFEEPGNFQLVFPDNGTVIHNLSHTGHPGIFLQAFHLLTGYDASGGLQLRGGGGHAAGNTVKDINRAVFPCPYHIQHALHSVHIGHLMRLRHNGGNAALCQPSAKCTRRQHGAFDVHMNVNQPRHHIKALCIHCLISLHRAGPAGIYV